LCGTDIAHPLLQTWLEPIRKLKEQLEARYEERLKMEGLMLVEGFPPIAPAAAAGEDEVEPLPQPPVPLVSPLYDPFSVYYRNPIRYGNEQLNYYPCAKCSRPYFGGLRRCQDVNREEPNRDDLVCGGCSAGSAVCDKHGNQYMEWKCKYCCNAAVWYCWGTTHFCELCHSPPRKSVREECPGEELCPLRGAHPPNGSEFAIGCAMCRSASILGSAAQRR
jgi:hypothetical protein